MGQMDRRDFVKTGAAAYSRPHSLQRSPRTFTIGALPLFSRRAPSASSDCRTLAVWRPLFGCSSVRHWHLASSPLFFRLVG